MSQPYNPYAPPRTVPQVAASRVAGQPMDWEPGEVLKLAWDRFGRYWFVLVIGYPLELLVTEAVSQGPVLAVKFGLLGGENTLVAALVQLFGSLAGAVLGAFIMVGLLRVCLDAARGKPVRFATLVLGGDRFVAMLGLYFVMGLLVTLGCLLFIVPGIILAFAWSFAPFYVVDANLGPIAAMRASWHTTSGQKGKIFGFSLLSMGIALLGVVACGVGVIPAMSLVYVAWAAAFTRASGREPAVPDGPWR